MKKFLSFRGIVTMINDFYTDNNTVGMGYSKLISVKNQDGNLVNFVVTPTTYFLNHITVALGDIVTGFYDGNTINEYNKVKGFHPFPPHIALLENKKFKILVKSN